MTLALGIVYDSPDVGKGTDARDEHEKGEEGCLPYGRHARYYPDVGVRGVGTL